MSLSHLNFMQAALTLAHTAFAKNEVPVGAIVVRDQTIIGRAHNETIARKDPTAHAEILAIQEACQFLGHSRLSECVMYVTLEPCCMCAGAVFNARLGQLFFSTPEPRSGTVRSIAALFDVPQLNLHCKAHSGLLEHESKALLQIFFQQHRNLKQSWL